MSTVKYKIPENWINTYLAPRYPDLVAPFREAADITLSALQNGQLDNSELATLLTYAASPKSILAENVVEMLGKLANAFPSAQEAIAEMATSKKQAMRSKALMALQFLAPGPLHEQIYANALRDTSKTIRATAAQVIQKSNLKTLLPVLAAAIECESDEEIRSWLNDSHSILRDGYCLKKIIEEQIVWVTYQDANGSRSKSFSTDSHAHELEAWVRLMTSQRSPRT
ncbi:hypothetical protein [Chitinilyticum litopenaei]|uniref:hypothetical protein n=1 Tax=Chitinilyticum litopenaei TaxID=1121276 RepID=UPI0003FE0A99|nr:hypothetical protein [Chitinilyticum litopenaei]